MLKFFNSLIIAIIPFIPTFLIRIFAKQYVAGITIDNAIDTVKKLNSKHLCVTLDILGEHTKNAKDANKITNEYIQIINKISICNLDCNISIKPSHIGTDLGKNIFIKNINAILDSAIINDNFVRIDMENSDLTDMTINFFKNNIEHKKNIGIVLQAYLYRTINDLSNLSSNINIRLCKGIYNEDETIAMKNPDDINKSYIKLLSMAFEKNIYVGIATHDQKLLEECLEIIDTKKINKNQFEFQMLHGVPMERHIQYLLSKEYKVRIYVPFGPDWYNYSIRRIKENPNILSYIIKNLFKR